MCDTFSYLLCQSNVYKSRFVRFSYTKYRLVLIESLM